MSDTNKTVRGAAYKAVDEAVHGGVGWAVRDTVREVVCEDLQHPALQDFLSGFDESL